MQSFISYQNTIQNRKKIERQAVNKLKRNTEVLNIVQFEQQLTQFIQLLQSVQFVQGLTKNERNSA